MRAHSRTYYNDIALRITQKVLGLKYLHYGFFEADIPKNLEGLKEAQERYTQKILSCIPKDVKTILDVGCGAGGNAKAMVDRGYTVSCVDPDPYLLERTSQITNGKITPFQGLYENVSTENKFDLVLMSESCQYIEPNLGWVNHVKNVKPGGYVMAVDFFKIRTLDKPYISKSGHNLAQFKEIATQSGFKLILDEDITSQTAPTMDIYQDLISNKFFPIFEGLFEFIDRKFPLVYKMLSFFLRKKIMFLKEKYSHQGAEEFAHYKGYYILLFQKNQ